MKKLWPLCLLGAVTNLAVLMNGCERQPEGTPSPWKDLPCPYPYGGYHSYVTVEIDGCEYLLVRGYREDSLTHKGDCKNPIHYENRN